MGYRNNSHLAIDFETKSKSALIPLIAGRRYGAMTPAMAQVGKALETMQCYQDNIPVTVANILNLVSSLVQSL